MLLYSFHPLSQFHFHLCLLLHGPMPFLLYIGSLFSPSPFLYPSKNKLGVRLSRLERNELNRSVQDKKHIFICSSLIAFESDILKPTVNVTFLNKHTYTRRFHINEIMEFQRKLNQIHLIIFMIRQYGITLIQCLLELYTHCTFSVRSYL